jgi:hypothetical protein
MLKAMQESQQKIKQKSSKEKSNKTSNEAYAMEQEMSEFLDAKHDLNEITEMQDFLENLETETCNHFLIVNKT